MKKCIVAKKLDIDIIINYKALNLNRFSAYIYIK